MDLTFNETLVGKAAQVCMRMNFQPAHYANYILKVCKTNVDCLVKSATNPHNAPANFCHYLKEFYYMMNLLLTLKTKYNKINDIRII